jgi:hypothetical protein
MGFLGSFNSWGGMERTKHTKENLDDAAFAYKEIVDEINKFMKSKNPDFSSKQALMLREDYLNARDEYEKIYTDLHGAPLQGDLPLPYGIRLDERYRGYLERQEKQFSLPVKEDSSEQPLSQNFYDSLSGSL